MSTYVLKNSETLTIAFLFDETKQIYGFAVHDDTDEETVYCVRPENLPELEKIRQPYEEFSEIVDECLVVAINKVKILKKFIKQNQHLVNLGYQFYAVELTDREGKKFLNSSYNTQWCQDAVSNAHCFGDLSSYENWCQHVSSAQSSSILDNLKPRDGCDFSHLKLLQDTKNPFFVRALEASMLFKKITKEQYDSLQARTTEEIDKQYHELLGPE